MPGEHRGPFYGYWIVAAAFLSNVITFGCGFYAFSLFVSPLQNALGWGRGDLMAGFTIFFLTSGLISPQAGKLLDRHGARAVMCTGAVIAGVGFVILAGVSSLWQYYLGYAVVGLGMAGTGQIPGSAVVSNWFEKKRGTAVGLMASGVGVGGLVLSPVAGGFLIPQFGWSRAFLVLGALCWLVIVPLALFVIRTHPREKGMVAYGHEPLGVSDPDLPRRFSGVPLKAALGTATFWLIAATYFLSHFAQVGAIQNQVPFFEDAGFPIGISAGALGAVGLSSAFGKFGFGLMTDRLAARYVLALGLALQLASLLVLISVGPGSPPAMAWLYSLMMGLGVGSWLPTMSMLVSGYYGLAHYGAIFGAVTIPYAVGSAVGPFVAGEMYDLYGNYHAVLILFLILYAVSIATILLARRPTLR